MTTFIHTLLGAKPPARTDGVPWSEVRVEHAETEEGPWTVDTTQALSPLDSNPREPSARDLTFGSLLTEAYFRLVFLDAESGESTPTDPVFDDGTGVSWRPTVSDVGQAWLRARTYVEGGDEAGTFTTETRPTATQAQTAISESVRRILAVFAANEVPDGSEIPARHAATIYAAYLIEMGYFPEQTEESSAFLQLRQQSDAALATLVIHAQVRDLFGEATVK